jgi:hypothetical protein
MCLRVSYMKKIGKKINLFFILRVTEERSWIRSRIRQSEVRIRPKMSRIPNTGLH